MAPRKVNYENLCRKLIKLVSDVKDENSEDFKECYSYAMSNFKYHRFLSVDSHKVHQKINGLCEKFTVHSQNDKAKDLRELTSKFLAMPLFEQKTFDHSDTHYSVVSLLIELASSPTGNSVYETNKNIIVEEGKDFDWAAYLMEGVDLCRSFYSSSPEFSDDEEDNEDGNDISEEDNKAEMMDSDKTKINDISLTDLNISEKSCLAQSEVDTSAYKWLNKNIITTYWNGTIQKIPESSSYYNIVKDWDFYDRKINSFKNEQFVTESQILREIIWMLLGVQDLYIFQYTGTTYKLRESIRLTHLSRIALENSVAMFLKAGNLMSELMSFIESVSLKQPKETELNISLTYGAFAFAVDQFLHEYKTLLCKVEQDVQKQKMTITILSLQRQLDPWIEKLVFIYNIYVNGVHKMRSVESNSEKAAALLSCLYDNITELHLISQNDLLSIALPLWIKTSQPYLHIIDEWITNGQLQDFNKEFIIQRGEISLTLDETFWKQSLVMKFSTPNWQNNDNDTEDKAGSSSPLSEVIYDIHDWTPPFLTAILQPITKAGKSMDIFSTLNCLSTLLTKRTPSQYQYPKSLFEMFLTYLNEYLDNEAKFGNVDDTTLVAADNAVHMEFPIKKVLDDQCNPLLQINLDYSFKKEPKTSWIKFDVEEIIKCLLCNWKCIHPVEHMLENCLYPHITEKYLWICKELVQTIIKDHNLMDYLAAMRNFFLMEAGDTMFEFYIKIFSSIQYDVDSYLNVTFLNRALTEALEKNFPDEIGKLSVYTQKLPGLSTIDAGIQLSDTNCINLAYTIPWPIDMIVNSKAITKYNLIFKMLLRIKRAKFSLETLRFDELERVYGDKKETTSNQDALRKGKIHRLHILRLRLLYFTNTLNSHIMHQIVHSRELLDKMNTSVDLDEMVSCHEAYLEKILQCCFLMKKNSPFSNLLDQILSIALRLNTQWKKGADRISLESLAEMEENFTKWIPFLRCCSAVKITIDQDSHLEHLLSSLTMACSE